MRRGLIFVSRRHVWNKAYDGMNFRAHRISVWNEEMDRSISSQPQQPSMMALDRLQGDGSRALGALVNGKLRDLKSPVAESDSVEEVTWDGGANAKSLLWHSSAHLLGDAIEQHFDRVLLCDGPALLNQQAGFFYEFWTPQTVSSQDFAGLEGLMMTLAQRKRKFEWLTLTPDRARHMFCYNPFKLHVLDSVEKLGQMATVYRCGDFIDLCRGPHIPNTGRVKWVKLLSTSAATSATSTVQDNPVSRIYGISFCSAEEGKKWVEQKEEAERRDHRVLGVKQNLFMFHDFSPGSAFFLPDGAYIYNRLIEMLRLEYTKRGYQEVITPVLFNKKLWETSGHWNHYKEDMYFLHNHEAEASEGPEVGLKPMNCPAHCLIYGHTSHSYRELPVRLADFGVLHRKEQSGALTGLTRVVKFQQDDAHIFCREDQLEGELVGCLDFIKSVYQKLGFGNDFSLRLATRPDSFVGDRELWDVAEETLRRTLSQFGRPWTVAEKDGAFYGPKMDVLVRDALGRMHQVGTVQLDFQLPRRFQLSYVAADGSFKHPVMIHRAILGSGERMFALLTENYAGKWPVWLNPRRVAVLPVADAHRPYAQKVLETLSDCRAYMIDDGNTLPKRVRAAQMAHYNYILVLGDEEEENSSVSVRLRDSKDVSVQPLDDFVKRIKSEQSL